MPAFVLEAFDAPQRAAPPMISEAEAEEIRRAAYETGFQAGATDATTAAQADQERLTAEVVASLQDMSFGFHEAAAHVMANVAPVLRAMVDTVMPKLMAETVGHTILETIAPIVEEAANIPVRVLVSPDEAPALRHILGEAADVPFVIVEDPGLDPGRAHLRIGAVERQIDVSGVLDRICAAVDAVTDRTERTIANG